MQTLSPDEHLAVRVAVATCVCYRLDRDNTPICDLAAYVQLLLRLHRDNPEALTDIPDKPTLKDVLSFCALQLSDVHPASASMLRAALDS